MKKTRRSIAHFQPWDKKLKEEERRWEEARLIYKKLSNELHYGQKNDHIMLMNKKSQQEKRYKAKIDCIFESPYDWI